MPHASLTSRSSVSRVLPLVVCAAIVIGCMLRFDVSAWDTVRFLVVQLVCYSLPGTLMWRLLWREPSSWATDVVFGTILGHALTLPFYLLCRAAGVPRLVVLVPLVVVSVFAVVPALRTCWRRRSLAPWPLWYSWSVSAGVALVALWFTTRTFLRPLSGVGILWQTTDSPYSLALAAELKNHFPPTTPFVTGEPLYYHWFVFADAAATNWQSGIELDALVFMLVPFLCVVMTFAGIAALSASAARRFSVGATTLALSVLVGSLNLFGWIPSLGLTDNTLLDVYWKASPTQAFGQMLSMPAVLVAIHLVRRPSDRRAWVLFVLLSAALMGAKATFIPVLGGGILLVLGWRLVTGRRDQLATVLLGAVLAAELVFAQLVLFGGASQGTALAVGSTFRRMASLYGFPASSVSAGLLPVLVAGLIVIAGWLLPLVGATVLFRRANRASEPDGAGIVLGTRGDPAVWLVLGVVIASVVAAALFDQPGWSQLFFLRSGLPLGYLLAGWGLVVLVTRLPRRARLPLLAQTIVVLAAGGFLWARTRHRPTGSAGSVAMELGLVLGAGLLTVLLLALGCSRLPSMRRLRGSALLACVGLSLPVLGALRTIDVASHAPAPPAYAALPARDQPIPDGGVTAARFVRDHSSPNDMIATNAHCRTPKTGPCDSRNHWVSAWSERRAVLAGWGYSATSNEGAANMSDVVHRPFWDLKLLALNDNVFRHPSRASLMALTRRYPVRWLIVDTRFPASVSELARLLPANHRFGDTVVYEVPVSLSS